MKKTARTKNGFTLVELLVVTTIVVLLLLSISAMFMTFLISGARNNIMREIKAEGAEMIDKIEFNMRSAQGVETTSGASITCSTNGSTTTMTGSNATLNIQDVNGADIPFEYVDNGTTDRHIELNNETLNSTYVLSGAPQVTCFRDAATQKTTIRITFTLSRNYEAVSTLSETFTALMQLRNS